MQPLSALARPWYPLSLRYSSGCTSEHLTSLQYLWSTDTVMSVPDELIDPARFFLEPRHARQRQYEALRAFFGEQRGPRGGRPPARGASAPGPRALSSL